MPALIRLVRPDCVDGGLAPADCMSSRLHGGLLPTVFTAVLCRLCSRRPLANCVHGGNHPTVFTAASSRLCLRRPLAVCVDGGNQPTVFTAACIRLCLFTADSCRLCARRQPADCVHGGFQPIVYATASCRLCSRRQGAPLTPSSTSSSHYNAATLCVLVLKNDRAVLLPLFLCGSLNVSVFSLMTEWFVFVFLRAPSSLRVSFLEAMAASTLAASSTMQSAYLYKYKDVRANRPQVR